jgi:virulence-associated protein VapD
MANLMDTLTDLLWFPSSVRDIRAFRVEQWSDFTDRVKRLGKPK